MYPKSKPVGKNLLVEDDEDNIYSDETRERWVEEEKLTHQEACLVKGYVDGGPKRREEPEEEEDDGEFFSWKSSWGFDGLK